MKRGKIEGEGGLSDYESLRASIAAPLMYSNAKCVRLGLDSLIDTTKLWGGALRFHSYAHLPLRVCVCACTHFYLLFKQLFLKTFVADQSHFHVNAGIFSRPLLASYQLILIWPSGQHWWLCLRPFIVPPWKVSTGGASCHTFCTQARIEPYLIV